ncbi:uncharacterized protein LOC108099413 [Drosophila ficusphila]|uniref:uncharacterized protein LOC108099413 n=1 Tax=Drosophila ficusphila TaxID=30025 RepID=UPI0007E616D3|nr:uncharacterized protein LOC108099413 [Drosophila ficusphila]
MKPQTKRKSFPFNAPPPGGVMEFGFGNCSHFNANGFGTPAENDLGKWQHKRKSELQATAVLPPKMLITEERITQHFSGLSLDPKINVAASAVGSNNNSVASVTGGLATDDIPSTSTGKTHHPNPAYQMAAMELEQKLRNANRIVICDGLKPATGPGSVPPVIPPEWLMKAIPRPCTALVPWQPSPLQIPMPGPKVVQPLAVTPMVGDLAAQELDDYDDLEFFENNNTCSVNLNKSEQEHMDEDL